MRSTAPYKEAIAWIAEHVYQKPKVPFETLDRFCMMVSEIFRRDVNQVHADVQHRKNQQTAYDDAMRRSGIRRIK